MAHGEGLAWQASLLDGAAEPRVDAGFGALRRVRLDDSSWVEHADGWLASSDVVFARLLEGVAWEHPIVPMYGRMIRQPRLSSGWLLSSGEPPPLPIIEDVRLLLSARYGVTFDSVGLNLYRDGRDSVAFHGDRIPPHVVDPLVAIASVGEPRRFLLRPRGGGRAVAFLLGRGDLLVTGGRCQREWEHGVPKVATAGPRISITFRHSA